MRLAHFRWRSQAKCLRCASSPSSADLSVYEAARRKLFQQCKGIDAEYRRLTSHKQGKRSAHVGKTSTRQLIHFAGRRHGDRLTRSLLQATRAEYQIGGAAGAYGILMNDVIVKHPTDMSWGVRIPISRREWARLRRLMSPSSIAADKKRRRAPGAGSAAVR